MLRFHSRRCAWPSSSCFENGRSTCTAHGVALSQQLAMQPAAALEPSPCAALGCRMDRMNARDDYGIIIILLYIYLFYIYL